jgi:hypothetical protein
MQLPAFTDGRQIHILVENLDIAIGLNVGSGQHTGRIGFEVNCFRSFAVQTKRNLLEVQDDIGGIFDDSRDRRKLMQNAFNLDGRDRRTFDGTVTLCARRADRRAKAALEGLGGNCP